MRIRRSASRLLGSEYSSPAPPPFDLPPPPPFELELPLPPPPPVLQPCSSSSAHAGSGGRLSASSAEPPCGHNRSPWDLMAQLDPSDPQELELFKDTYFVSVTYRTSWLFPASMPAAWMKEEDQEEEEDMEVDMAEEENYEPWKKVAKKKAAKKRVMKHKEEGRNVSRPRKKAKVKTDEDEEDQMADGGELWMCKKNDGKTWFCRRTVSQPDSYCLYHSDPKRPLQQASLAASKPSKRRRKRALDVGEGFYYYAGFGPSCSKRQCRPSSSMMESPPAGEKEQAPTEEKEEAPPEEPADLSSDEPRADDSDPQVAPAHVDEPTCDDTVGIAGCDEESSDDAFAWNGKPQVVGANEGIKRKSPFKKRWRKPVKARSLKSLMI